MRPKSIRLFEWIILASIALGIVNVLVSWDAVVAELSSQPGLPAPAPVFLAAASAFSALVYLLLWYFVARRASLVAKWIFVALVALNVGSTGWQLSRSELAADSTSVLGLAVLGLMIAAAVLLFHPDSKAWFAGARRRSDPHSLA